MRQRLFSAGVSRADHDVAAREELPRIAAMSMSLLRMQDRRLLLTFTVRDLMPPLGVRALIGIETDDGFDFDFAHDRMMLDSKTPLEQPQGGGFGPTVQLADGTLVTSYSYRGGDKATHLEVVRWQAPTPKTEPRK